MGQVMLEESNSDKEEVSKDDLNDDIIENLQNPSISATMLSTLSQCKYKFYLQYVKHEQQLSGPALVLGSLIHRVLEAINLLMKKQSRTIAEEYDYQFMGRVLAEESINMSVPPKLVEEANDVLIFALDGWTSRGPIIDVEKRFRYLPILVDKQSLKVSGAIDRLVEIDNNTLLVEDYKSSRIALTDNEARVDVQLSMYDLVSRILYPRYRNVILSLNYVRTGNRVISYRDEAQREQFKKFLVAAKRSIERFTEKDAVPNVNTMCGNCQYRHKCAAYLRVINESLDGKHVTGTYKPTDLVTEWEKIRLAKKLIDDREKEIRACISDKLDFTEESLVADDGTYIQPVQGTMVKYDPRSLYEVVEADEFLNMVSITKSRADKFIKANPRYKEFIESRASVSYKSPAYTIKKPKVKGQGNGAD